MRKNVQNDLDVIAERLVPYSVRGKTRERLNQLKEEFRRRLENLEGLTRGGRLGCPLCKDAENVVITGNGRGGTKKFICRRSHRFAGRKGGPFRFSSYTSYEALKVYHDFLVEVLALLTFCEGTYEGVAKYLNVSKHMVEFGTAVLLDYLGKKGGKEKITVGDGLVAVYADFSTTRVSRAASLVMSSINGEIAYQVCCSVNYLTAWNFVRALRERLAIPHGATVVFVTDGESAWVDPIRAFFPEAVHVRQFHSESSRGLVYVHFPFRGRIYTLRCLWSAVLERGEASERVLKMRHRRKLESKKKSPNRTELFDGVILWEGVVYEPRGVRRKRGVTVSEAMGTGDNSGGGAAAEEGSKRAPDARKEGFETLEEMRRDGRWHTAPRTDGAKRVFEGSLQDALRIPAVKHAHSILVRVFGGLYITSNAIECHFGIKQALKYHRTVKRGSALIHVLLYLNTRLRRLSRAEVKGFLMDEVVTFERIRHVAVGTRIGQNNQDRGERAKRVVLEAYRQSRPIVIRYRDASGRRTSRMIERLRVERDQYTGMLKVKAYCRLRNADRTFLLDRITNAIPVDTNLSIVA